MSQLIKSIARVLQKLLGNNFINVINGAIILTAFVPLLPVLPAIFLLSLNEALLLVVAGKSLTVPLASNAGLSLYDSHYFPNVF